MKRWIVGVLLLLMLSGCDERGPSGAQDITPYLTSRFPGLAWELGRMWEAEELPGVDWAWEVWLSDAEGSFLAGRTVAGQPFDTSAYAQGKPLFEQYKGQVDTLLEEVEHSHEPRSELRLQAEYTSRAELGEAYRQMEAFFTYLTDWGTEVPVSVRLILREDLTNWGGSANYDVVYRGAVPPLEELEGRYARFLLAHNAGEDEFYTLELAVHRRQAPKLVLTDWAGVTLPLDQVVPCQDGVSFGALYGVLDELGFVLEGDSRAFTVTGVGGKRYHFSYAQCTPEGRWYYLRDGAQVMLGTQAAVGAREIYALTGLRLEVEE